MITGDADMITEDAEINNNTQEVASYKLETQHSIKCIENIMEKLFFSYFNFDFVP